MSGLNSPEFLIAYNLSKTLSSRNKAYLRSIEDYTKMKQGHCFASQTRIGGRLSQYRYRRNIGKRQSVEAYGQLRRLNLIVSDRPHNRATYRTALTNIGKLTAMIIQDDCPEKIMDKRMGLQSEQRREYINPVNRHIDRFSPKPAPQEARHVSEFAQIPHLKNHELERVINQESAPQIDHNPHLKIVKSAPPNLNSINEHITQQPLTREVGVDGGNVVVLGRQMLVRDEVCFKTGLHQTYYGKIEKAGLLEHLSFEGRDRLSEAIQVKIEKGQTITDPVAWARGVCRKLMEEQNLEQQLKNDQRANAESSLAATTAESRELFDIDTGTLEERKAIVSRNRAIWQSMGLRVGEAIRA